MILTRDKGQRMWGNGGSGAAGNGGMSASQMAGFATQDWVDQNYLSIEFFARLFKAYGPGEDEGDTDVEVVPNDMESTITNIKAMVGLWTEEYLSAMGLDPTEGGGISLNEPLASINSAGLSSHPSSSGQTIIWNGSSWAYGTTGSGSVTYVGLVAPAGFNVTGSPVTSMGTLTLTYESGYSLPLTADVTKGVTAYGWGNHATAGYALASNVYSKTDADGRFLTISFFRSLFKAYTSDDVEVQPNSGNTATIDNIKAMFGFWTEQYISAMGQDTSGGGISLNEPLASINSAGLSSHPSSSGQTIIWNGSSWAYGTAGGASALYALSDVNVSGVTSGQYLKFNGLKWVPDTPGLNTYLPLTGGSLSGDLSINGKLSLSGSVYCGGHILASQSWVTNHGYLTSSDLSSYMPKSGGTFTGSIFTSSSAYVVIGTSTGEQGKNLYVSGNAKVTGDLYIGNYAAATQSWVTNQGYLTSSALSSYMPKSGGTFTGSIFTSSSAYVVIGTSTGEQGKNLYVSGNAKVTGDLYIGNYAAATQNWVQNQGYLTSATGYLALTGGTMSGVIQSTNTGRVLAWGSGYDFYLGHNTTNDTFYIASNNYTSSFICFVGREERMRITKDGYTTFFNSVFCHSYLIVNTQTGEQGYPFYCSGNGKFTGSCTATSHPTSSDMRMKDIVKYIDMKLEDIAAAPSFLYRWKNSTDMKVYAGSSAQYWQLALPQVVWEAQDQMRSLSLSYDVAALISVIAVAKRVVNHEERIKQLEAENEALRHEIEDLKAGDLQTE